MEVCKKNLPGFFVSVFYFWVFVSSLYYIGNLFSGDVWASRDSNEFHKVFKYVVAFALSISSLILLRIRYFFLYYIFLAFIFSIFAGAWLFGWNVLYAIDLLIVFISFVGMIVLVSCLDDRKLNQLIYMIIASGIFVGYFSFYEYFFLDEILGDYWESTGGYRSISTLLNPNNLGLYMGAVILLLFKSNVGACYKFLLTCYFLTALMLSGSRTAVMALIVAWIISSVYFAAGRSRALSIVVWLVSIFLTSLIYIFLLNLSGLPERAVDMQTAFIRIEKYVQYILDFNFEYFFPDVDERRFFFVSESSYFHALNSLGLLISFLIALSFSSFFVVKPVRAMNGRPIEALRIVFVYYVVASFFENVFMSFPNNQLFFMSAGCVFGLRNLNATQIR